MYSPVLETATEFEMNSFIDSVSYLGPLQSVGAGQRDKNARVLAIVHAVVPCKEELLVVGKTTAVPITILKILSPGFGIAPFAMNKKPNSGPAPLKDGEVAEPLFQIVNDIENNEPSSLNLWS